MCNPLQTAGKPLAVRRQTPLLVAPLGPRKTDTEAPESTKTLDWTGYLAGRLGRNSRSHLEQKLEEENQQVGWGVQPARLLVFRHGTRFPAIDCLVSMLLMEPTGTGRWRGSEGQS